MSDGISVRGGAGGVDAHLDDLEQTATLLTRAASLIDDASGNSFLLLWSLDRDDALFAADAYGAAEARLLLRAAVGSATRASEDARHLAALLHRAVDLYRHADGGVLHAVTGAVGTLWRAGGALPAAVVDGAGALFSGGPAAAAQRVLTSDPALLDVVADPGRLALFSPGSAFEVSTLVAALRRYCLDGPPVVRATGIDSAGEPPPRDVADLMSALQRRNAGADGAIDVRILTGRDGTRHVVVDIPGTKDLAPHRRSITAVDLASDLRAIDGSRTGYEDGVLEAMRAAGVRRDDDVMLVGHSLGGMVAVAAARDATRSGAFRISHVVTAGAPVGSFAGQLPRSVQLLALENRHDLVPRLDGAENPDRSNITTVSFDGSSDSVGDAHGIETSYRPGAVLADRSDDPAIRAFRNGAGGFFTATTARTDTYLITRAGG